MLLAITLAISTIPVEAYATKNTNDSVPLYVRSIDCPNEYIELCF